MRRKHRNTNSNQVFIGVASTIGSGIFVITGSVVEKAGPAALISYLISGVAAFLSALCYCEFSSLFPYSGSAYSYIYFTFGEFPAFIIGWNLILEYTVGASSVIRSFTTYAKNFFPFKLEGINFRLINFKFEIDFYVLVVAVLFSLISLINIQKLKSVNKLSTFVSLTSLVFITLIGLKYINKNFISPFMPNGVLGIISASSSCFYSYIGFDIIASTAEEAVNPKRNVPISIMLTIAICMLLYISSTAIITLIIPFDFFFADTTFITAFSYHKDFLGVFIVSVGSFASFFSCIIISFFPVPRILFAMSNDGLLPKLFGSNGSSLFSFVIPLEELIDMMSIGTLTAYSMISLCVILLRYNILELPLSHKCDNNVVVNGNFDQNRFKRKVVNSLLLMIFLMILFAFLMKYSLNQLFHRFDFFVLSIISILIILILVNIRLSKFSTFQAWNSDHFTVPCLPWTPCMSIFVNIILLTSIKSSAWNSYFIWLFIGIFIYFGYGIRYSLA
ncbi:hypothetical protein MXB_4033 [Myxobolus squamalis]|nr:hypothetical protein MXB_4033 [Myxobolus squamalis]